MRATNAKIDLPAFAGRSIRLPSFPGGPESVNHVLRFQHAFTLFLNEKSPQDVQRPTGLVARPAPPRRGLACLQFAPWAGRLQAVRI
jgi:hypothetical protein